MNEPEGDMTAAKIELYLKPSGDELDRAEAYEAVTLREQNRTTTGTRLTYTTADERYVVTRHAGDDRRRMRPRDHRHGR